MLLFLRITLRYLLRLLLGLTCFLLLYLLCAWLLPKIKVNRDFIETTEGIEIFVKSNGVHTDLVVPASNEIKNWKTFFPHTAFNKVDSTFQYLAFGWGDKGFYLYTPTWSDLRFSTAFKAAFFLGTTAMHVTAYQNKPGENSSCISINLSPEQYQKLVQYIHSSFQLENAGYILIDHPGYSDNDVFYEANGTYSFLKTCNCWTGSGLKKAGVKTGCWTPLESGVLGSVKNN